jgi:hypothetical protein
MLAETNWAGRLPRNPKHASGIFAEHAGIDRIRLAALAERLCEGSCPTRIDDADLHLAVRLHGQRQIQTVIPTGFQADSYSPAAAEQVGDQGLVSGRMVRELSQGRLVVSLTVA